MAFFDEVDQVFATWKYDHPRILYALIRSLKPETVVEVGTYRGYAAAWMAQALKENGKGHLYCIDDFSEGTQQKYDSKHWEDNLRILGVLDHYTLIVGKSQEVTWPDKVDFAYIDGWHSFDAAHQDFSEAWARGASCICLDDVKSTIGPSMLAQRIKNTPFWDVAEIFSDCGLAICTFRQPRPEVNFSQELDGPGTVMTGWSVTERLEHLNKAVERNKMSYIGFDFGWGI